MAVAGCFLVDGPLPADAFDPRPLIGPDHGALASFVGTVRDEHHDRTVTRIYYECHRCLAASVLTDLVAGLERDFGPLRIHISHGLGWIDPTGGAVAIHVTAPHRAAALAACREAIERIKVDLPVWKHEHYADGTSAWLPGS